MVMLRDSLPRREFLLSYVVFPYIPHFKHLFRNKAHPKLMWWDKNECKQEKMFRHNVDGF